MPLATCTSQFTWTDLSFFLFQASQLGFYYGFSWDLDSMVNGFYNVSVPGAKSSTLTASQTLN